MYGDARCDAVHLVAHSMGGMFTRAAIRQMKESDSPVWISSLTTLGRGDGVVPPERLLIPRA